MISSRREKSVNKAVERLRAHGYTAHGTTCHVGNPDEIIALMDKVGITFINDVTLKTEKMSF